MSIEDGIARSTSVAAKVLLLPSARARLPGKMGEVYKALRSPCGMHLPTTDAPSKISICDSELCQLNIVFCFRVLSGLAVRPLYNDTCLVVPVDSHLASIARVKARV